MQDSFGTEPQADSNIALFPLDRQTGRVRAAAAELLKKRSAAAANRYRDQLAREKFVELASLGLSEDAQDEAIGAFLTEVERELAELHYERIRLNI